MNRTNDEIFLSSNFLMIKVGLMYFSEGFKFLMKWDLILHFEEREIPRSH